MVTFFRVLNLLLLSSGKMVLNYGNFLKGSLVYFRYLLFQQVICIYAKGVEVESIDVYVRVMQSLHPLHHHHNINIKFMYVYVRLV